MLSRLTRSLGFRIMSSPVHKKAKLEVSIEQPVVQKKPQQPKKDKAQKQAEKYAKLQKKSKLQSVERGGPEENIFLDVRHLLGDAVVDTHIKEESCFAAKYDFGTELELEISQMSSSGDGLAITECKSWVVAVPFCLPGERILARVYRNSYCHSYADLVKVLDKRDSWRDDEQIKCRYFGSCSGCQYQMIPYERQLLLKQRVVEKAYERFSHLAPELIPSILPTIASPKQYNYRTKITPHFQAAPKNAGDDYDAKIGFDMKGRRSTIDIEECPIATETLNVGMKPARANVKATIKNYKRGATLLLRDSMVRPADAASATSVDIPPVDLSTIKPDERTCITDHKQITREIVGDKLFEFTAGSFFQNNSSILVPLTQYVLEALPEKKKDPMYLVDTYCGAGLFSICLQERFDKVAGIEISEQSISYAKHNVKLNGLDDSKISFRVGRSEAIFDVVKDFPAENTSVIIDPPRKGCDEPFISQLKQFRPHRVVYVSCNVHTQARDVGMLCGEDGPYSIESLRGFDLFPQTSHVEGVAVLKLK
ncbi:S-adenosyl-L-methionine-dependent methyltransferase [Wallemia mellicola CBS 633.66]|uniref:S-adenosyl-L-methionine-dependent methyltransferase n=1 Tax=Wallemia mellicola (strain ATCC MYA-4683 / CBS 633.66) TaxID=671144 RepID=I4YAL5_WALMC|nr:S-adenosyl-L-methionine-dependent methyltransferase [Wallemia mellicola CBS 633.66]EIM21007.1 S-adenosyl-L-methionine-dependent methyltransferase [Wallemia mellicola CBS 633.66]|eukprot:XP_006958993.1 S-adenosyl-L-methionine-dependent methyltransferase [Wallemia mellicola CBS 633.66]